MLWRCHADQAGRCRPSLGRLPQPRLGDRTEVQLNPGQPAHAFSPNYAVNFGWKPCDFVLWDNQTTWHYAVNEYDGPRVYRKVIGG
jgi:hypothetical protein